jgi:hypothetical protein
LDTDNYKDFAPTEHDLGLPNVQTFARAEQTRVIEAVSEFKRGA